MSSFHSIKSNSLRYYTSLVIAAYGSMDLLGVVDVDLNEA